MSIGSRTNEANFLRPVSPSQKYLLTIVVITSNIGFVSSKLAAEIGQSKPFALLEEEALLNLMRTHEFIQQRQTIFLKPFGLTATQYNILRILRGAGQNGVTCSQAAERMIVADPDITRLLDRLETRKLIRRERGLEDRRVVLSYITAEGLELLKSVDKPISEFVRKLAGHIERNKLQQFIETLEALREP
jgi:DNA-binding MarR family transcriptional regulator